MLFVPANGLMFLTNIALKWTIDSCKYTSHTVVKEHIPHKDMKYLGFLALDRNHIIHKIVSIYLNTQTG